MMEVERVANCEYMKKPKGKKLASEWNDLHPQWSYGDNTRRFFRDYHRAKRMVAVGPPYQR
jgi:hypothetical protein